MTEYPPGFEEYKIAHPDYFPEGSTEDDQIKEYQRIKRLEKQFENNKQQQFRALDKAVEAKSAVVPVDDEWTELVHPRKQVVNQRMRNLLRIHHPNVALAHILNEIHGKQAPDGGDVRFDVDRDSWLVWNERYWVEDPKGIFVVGIAERLLYDLKEEAEALNDKGLGDGVMDTQGHGNVKAALGFLKPMVAVNTDVFDVNPALINLQNGTYDVVNKEFYKHRKDDYITKIAGVDYKPDMVCPMWINHVKLVLPDPATRLALQIYLGHALVAGNPENAALFAYGVGKNGKTVTFATIDAVLGMYASGANATTFSEKINDEAPRQDLARMKGARLITVPEGKHGRKLDEGVLKNLTGGSDDVTARYLYGREFSFKPTAKLVFHTNHLPRIIGRDNGIWRRIYPIPFTTVVPEELRIADYDKKLYGEEGSGILNWLIEGYRIYKEVWGSLIYCNQINEARVLYKDKEDVLGDFFDQYKITGDINDKIARSELYEEYKIWCRYEEGGDKPFNKPRFNALVEDRVGSPIKHVGIWTWLGIKTPAEKMKDKMAKRFKEECERNARGIQ